MKRTFTPRAAAFAALLLAPLFLAACDSTTSSDGVLDPSVAQQVVAERADPDRALAERVKKALGTNTGAAYGVEVTAADGAVSLWGTVDSTAARRRLATTAAGVIGVRALENHINVDPGA
jgi:osmotically-inducible protein OsmY